MGVFKGQMTSKVLGYLEDNHIYHEQPLDVSVNRCGKSFMKRKFTMWYAEQIGLPIDAGVEFDKMEVKLTLVTDGIV